MWVPTDSELFFDFETDTLSVDVYYDFAAEGNISVSHAGVLSPTIAPNVPSAQFSYAGGSSVRVRTIVPTLEGIFPLEDITYLEKDEQTGVYSDVTVADWALVPSNKPIKAFNADPTINFVYNLTVTSNGVTPAPASVPLVEVRVYTITILQQYNTNRDILRQKVSEGDTENAIS